MTKKVSIVLSVALMIAALPASAGPGVPATPSTDAVVALVAPAVGATAECGGLSPAAGEETIDLREVLNGFEPVPAAPPWGCITWGVCSVDCHISCFYNEDCPLVDGFRQICLCSGQCP